MAGVMIDVHATKGDIEMRLVCAQRTHEPAVITAGGMLVSDNKLEGFTLGETTDSRRGMQGLQKIADMGMIRQAEGEVASEVNEVGRSHRARSLFTEIARKLFQALRDIGSHDAVPGTP